MKVEIIGLNHTGAGIGKINNKTIFVNKTIPNDLVEIENLVHHKNYDESTIKKIITPSPKRIKPQCPYFEKCGGCQIMELNYQDQLQYKKDIVKNILKKYANLEIDPNIKESKQFHYRNKITLQVENGIIGLYEQKTNNLIPIKECLLISNQMNQIIPLLKKLDLSNIKKIIIREANEHIMVQLIGTIDKKMLIQTLSNYVSSIYVNNNKIYGTNTIEETLENYHFTISPNSFFQVNKNQTTNLYNQIKKYLEPNQNHVLDLYCGTGSISIFISSNCKKITGIEINEFAVKDSAKNLKRNQLNNIEIKQGNVNDLLKENNTYDAIIVDPPRSGLDKKTKQTLLKIKSQKIIYVSCNPITLARDLKEFQTVYNLKDITLFDMFPNTYHVETVCYMQKK